MTLYGLIGRTLGHSFSAKFFTDKFVTEQIDAQYLNFELPDISLLPSLIDSYPDLQGLNVTIPYKQAVIPLLDAIDYTAAHIGAVNTIKISHTSCGHHLTGYNTDAPGFLVGLQLLCPVNLPTHALILGGTGGAAAAVIYALNSRGVHCTVVSRTAAPNQLTYADLTPEVINSHLLIVNCTPLGTFPNTNDKPPIPYHLLTSAHYAYDLVYNPRQTAFMRACANQGATTINGLSMLHAQARYAYEFWTQP